MRKGFTLIEIMIVITVMSILAGALVIYNSSSRQQLVIYVEQAKIAQLVLRARALALSTFTAPNAPCGYGVYFDYANRTYSLFGYSERSCREISQVNHDPTIRDPVYPDQMAYFVLEENKLNPQLKFGAGVERLEDILFVPPDPSTKIWLEGSGAPILSGGTGNIYLETVDGTSKLRLQVGTGGQISF